MNWTRIEGNWDQLKGDLRSRWGKLTDDDLDVVAGKKDKLIGLLKERYGMARDEVESKLDDWIDELDSKTANA